MPKLAKAHRSRVLLIVFITSLLILTIVAFFLLPGIIDTANTSPTARIVVLLDNSSTSLSWPINTALPVSGSVYTYQPLKSLDLWVNGNLIESREILIDQGKQNFEFSWQPDFIGSYSIFVEAVASDLQSQTSSAIRVDVIPTGLPLVLFTVEQDESPASIAARYNVSTESLLDANPGMDENTRLPAGENILIPLFSTNPVSQSVPNNQVLPLNGDALEAQLQTDAPTLIQKISSGFNPADAPPEAPLLEAFLSEENGECRANLEIMDLSNSEDGFRVYRLNPGTGLFEVVATLEKITDGEPRTYSEPIYGKQLNYYLGAYNQAGETTSQPVFLQIDSAICALDNPSGLLVNNNVLQIPENVDSLYLYYSINNNNWQRIPAIPDWFLTSEDNLYDLTSFLGNLDELPPNSIIDMEVWGWQGNDLSLLGRLHYEVNNSALWICSQASACKQGSGWTTEYSINSESETSDRQLQWTTNASQADSGIWQVSSLPFPNEISLDPPGLLLSGSAGEALPGPAGEEFNLDFRVLDGLRNGEPPQPSSPEEAQGLEWLFPSLQPFSYESPSSVWLSSGLPSYSAPFYIRVIPMSGNQIAGSTSNTVLAYFQPYQESDNPLIPTEPLPPDILEVEIVDFTTITPPSLSWGCVVIKDIDHDTFVNAQPYNTDVEEDYNNYRNAMLNGTPICPSSYQGVGEPPWYESMWDTLSSAASWFSGVYNDIKSAVIDVVAQALDALPLMECDASCRFLLEQGLNAGMVALGIPPEIPNLEQLTDQGMDYLIQAAVEEAGISCDSDCQQILRDGIKQMAEETRQEQVNQLCTNMEESHRNGKEPLCLPAGITAAPAAASTTQPAEITIEFSRKPGTEDVSEADLARYNLEIAFPAVNNSYPEGLRVQVNTGFYEGGYSVTSYSEYLPLDAPLSGSMFRTISTHPPIPAPGESQTLTFTLTPTDYWLPGHKDLIQEEGGFVRYNDYWVFYDDAEMTISASILCVQHSTVDYDKILPCGGSDQLERTLSRDADWH